MKRTTKTAITAIIGVAVLALFVVVLSGDLMTPSPGGEYLVGEAGGKGGPLNGPKIKLWDVDYYDYDISHPDMFLDPELWPDADHGDPLSVEQDWDTDWYDEQYYVRTGTFAYT